MLLFGCTYDAEGPTSEPTGTGGTVVSTGGSTTTTTTSPTTTPSVTSSAAINPETEAQKAVLYEVGVGEVGIYYQLGLSDTYVYTVEECEDSTANFKKTIFYVNYHKPDPFIESVYMRFYYDGQFREKSLAQYAPTTEEKEINGIVSNECYEKGWVEMYNDGNAELLWSGPVYPNN